MKGNIADVEKIERGAKFADVRISLCQLMTRKETAI